MSNSVVKEGNPLTVTMTFRDEDNVVYTPSTVRYRIKDLTNNRVVLDWTSVTPDSTVDIVITPSLNDIYDTDTRNRRRFEERSVVVQADYGTDSQFVDEFLYRVINIRGYES